MRKITAAQHTPFKPARADLAEACFIAQWQALNLESPSLLLDILRCKRCDVRSARVAASFVMWIGSNAGASFIAQAKARIEDYTYAEPAYLATWALANRRERHVSANVRAIEVIMSPENLFREVHGDQPFARASKLAISLSDIDVIESLVVWLSTTQGDSFVSACVANYHCLQALERSKRNLASVEG